MADPKLIFQAVTSANHAKAINQLLGFTDPKEILFSVAFVREAGLEAIENAIKPVASKTKFFIGIRNEITSIQAVKRLIGMNVEVYAVDTGSRNIIFHPKLYLVANNDEAQVIIGSANMTFGGLHNNIEMSTSMKLDLSIPLEKTFVNTALNSFKELKKTHPKHVFKIKGDAHADKLLETGRLADETTVPAPQTTSSIKKEKRDDLIRMKLNFTAPKKTKKAHFKAPAGVLGKKKASLPATAKTMSTKSGYCLVWESKGLTERDLNIPKGPTTNATGSMGFKKGIFTDIDQRHYFREEIFNILDWTKDDKNKNIERAEASFEIIIKYTNYGTFNLKLSHNTNTKSTTYKQNNSVTGLHWGIAKKYIAKPDLLGRIFYLYQKNSNLKTFLIEID